MSRKLKLPRNPKKAPKRTRSVITPHLRLNVLKDYHVNNMTITSICDRYSCCYETVKKILNTTEYKPECFQSFSPGDVFQRKEMNPLERTKMLTEDATQVVELTLAYMRFKLYQELRRSEANEDYTATVPIKELTLFFAEVAPYVLQKIGKTKESGLVVQSSRTKIHDMFKKEQADKIRNLN
jgi:hypothetical protein